MPVRGHQDAVNPFAVDGQPVFVAPAGKNRVAALAAQHQVIPQIVEEHLAFFEPGIELALNLRDAQRKSLAVQCHCFAVQLPSQRGGQCQSNAERPPGHLTAKKYLCSERH